MLQSFLVIRQAETSVPAYKSSFEDEYETEWDAGSSAFEDPSPLLSAAGFRMNETIFETNLNLDYVRKYDAIVFHLPYSILKEHLDTDAEPFRSLPLFWWCHNEPIIHNCKLADSIDGILYPGLTVSKLHWSLLLATKQYMQRTQWNKEREQLLAKLEDRKWIDRAKSILSEVKNITEAEAYEFLRKQAMNERRRLVDVAVSIVKVYTLLKEQNPRGKAR